MKKDSVIDEIILFCFYSLLLSCPVFSVEIPIAEEKEKQDNKKKK
jgi:hypothetical protein